MGSLSLNWLHSPAAQARFLGWRVYWVGLAHDFWKDSPFPWERWSSRPQQKQQPYVTHSDKETSHQTDTAGHAHGFEHKWNGDRIQVIEKMWGEGHVFPGNDTYVDSLLAPLGLTKEMSVLDLNAGLGSMARTIAAEYNAYVTGLEPNQTIAARGMVMSLAAGKTKQAPISAYDPTTYTASRKYDCVIARELFFKIIGKEKLFQAVTTSLKSGGGQLVFTDYILDPAHSGAPAIRDWLTREESVAPLSSVDTIKMWKELGLDVRVAEDQTAPYRREIMKGLVRLLRFLSSTKLDPSVRPIIMGEVDLWATRVTAMEHGLKYYRFSAIKK